jgi:glycosyltransferase involved in cell wall biosynthesis
VAGVLNGAFFSPAPDLNPAPEISLVIPSYNRADSVLRLLQGLAGQTANPESFEVVLVLDGCTDDSAEAVRSVELPFALRVVEQTGQGRARARNHGILKARGRLILFLDDDMDCDPALVDVHLAAHREHPGDVVLGYYPMLPAEKSTPERERLRLWWDEQFAKRSAPGHASTYHDFLTGNVSLSRELLLRVNGFEGTMPRIATCEDWELGFRLLKAGAKFRDCREAWCVHRTATKHIVYRAREEGAGQAVMAKKHPELFFDLPLSRFSAVFEKPVLWPAIRLLWRCPALVNLASGLLNRIYLVAARLGLSRVQAWLEFYARRCEYWRGLRLVFNSAEEWHKTCLKAFALRAQSVAEKELDAKKAAANC